jgi:uncharacterized protein (TIGR00255 family)
MIFSMTGFGVASFQVDDARFGIEVRSVNHRHLDVRVRVPRALSALESDARSRIQSRFARGKFDCNVASGTGESGAARVEVDREAAGRYLEAARQLATDEGLDPTLAVSDVLALPGVANAVERVYPEDALRASFLEGLDRALEALAAMRASEGAALEEDVRARLARILTLADELEARASLVQEAVRERLRTRAQKLQAETGLLDEARLHQEVVLHADRLDVTEEIVRLRSHVEQFRSLMSGDPAPVGRKLDFLLQEMSREANTIGSKGADAPVAHLVVDLKTELERIREQIQNVE